MSAAVSTVSESIAGSSTSYTSFPSVSVPATPHFVAPPTSSVTPFQSSGGDVTLQTGSSSSTAAVPSSTEATSSSPEAASSSSVTVPTFRDGGGLSKGAIAGVAVGSILAVAILLLAVWRLFRRRKRRKLIGSNPISDEKQVRHPSDFDGIQKPELHADHLLPVELPSSEYHIASELETPAAYQNMEQQHPMGLHTSSHTPVPEIQIPTYQPVEEPSHRAAPQEELPNFPASNSSHPETHAVLPPPVAQDARPEPLPSSPGLTAAEIRRLSPEDIVRLEEEERRIDAEIEEARRLKELRDRKFAIQQKLREAKGN